MWRFPLKLVSVEPPPDDVIVIEAYRLNSESVVGFRLTSKSEYFTFLFGNCSIDDILTINDYILK